jgi:hypothetical protein
MKTVQLNLKYPESPGMNPSKIFLTFSIFYTLLFISF